MGPITGRAGAKRRSTDGNYIAGPVRCIGWLCRSRAAAPDTAGNGDGLVVKLRLRVDPIKCKAHGMCGELFPERIRMDDWGYPIIDPRALSDDVLEHARRAVAECPRSALRVDLIDDPGARDRPDDPD